jgi:hypothetical protein
MEFNSWEYYIIIQYPVSATDISIEPDFGNGSRRDLPRLQPSQMLVEFMRSRNGEPVDHLLAREVAY